MPRTSNPKPEPLERLRQVPFVNALKYTAEDDASDTGWDGRIEIETHDGKYLLVAEEKRSYLTRAAVEQLLAWLRHLRAGRTEEVIVLARHVPRAAAERLIEEKVNFVDDAGNTHLTLGDKYNWTVMGAAAGAPARERRRTSPATLQLLFQFVTQPESLNWPVRQLESPAGIGKSRAAQARRQMIDDGVLVQIGKRYELGPMNVVADRLVAGYAQVLRPKLVYGRFRAPEATTGEFLARLRRDAPEGVRYALSGGPAADLLQHYYQGPETPLFLAPWASNVPRQLRLLPDRDGPITLMNAFGEVVFWDKRAGHTVAPPWLVYAELLSTNDSRAHEAATELRRELLG